MSQKQQDEQLEALLEYLQRNRGFDFRGYKRASLTRRIQRRMEVVRESDFEHYLDYLEVHPEEFSLLFNTILINVTAFFRDAPTWDYLAKEVLPRLIDEKKATDPIRVWSAGCASGEEAYSVAMLLGELVGDDAFRKRVKIYATDVDEEALAQARQATYSGKDLQPVPPELREKYFERTGDQYTFRPDLRRAIIFGRHDLIMDAPISRLDLIVCRNTLMYFNAETQMRILTRLHFALHDQGALFLGRAEMLLTHSSLFTPLELKHRIFKKVPQGNNLRERLVLLAQAGHPEVGNQIGRQLRLREIAFDTAPTARVVLDFNGNLVLATVQARAFFGVETKDIGRPFQDLELSYRPVELRSLIEEAYHERHAIQRSDVDRVLPDGGVQYLEIDVTPLQDNGGGFIGVSITFLDVTKFHQLQKDLLRSKQEVETAYEELQSSNEELETTNEELQSTVEELETTNEELQSGNEEMETMNEELQSTNEELQTLNDELRTRTEELNTANGFLQSILGSLMAGVVVLDRQLNVLIWNGAAAELWGLHPDEVRGQAFFNLDIGLPVELLRGLIRNILSEKMDRQTMVLNTTNRRGKAMRCQVTGTPLLNAERKTQGVVILMEDMEQVEKSSRTNNVQGNKLRRKKS
ncbi:MAG: CheR family methyltransferase [Candidatus Binatia bacterium]